MNTKVIMTAASVVLGAGGGLCLFAPEIVLRVLIRPQIELLEVLSLVVQVLGAMYFAFAMMNWTAKESVIGGIYNRPLSIGNFAHFLIGTFVLARYLLSNRGQGLLVVVLVVYVIFAGLFWWLVFRHSGIATQSPTD